MSTSTSLRASIKHCVKHAREDELMSSNSCSNSEQDTSEDTLYNVSEARRREASSLLLPLSWPPKSNMEVSPIEELLELCEECIADDRETIARISLLLKQYPENIDLSECLVHSSSSGDNILLTKILLADSRVDPANDESCALVCAVQRGRSEIVKLLLAEGRSDLNTGEGICLDVAIEEGHTDIAKLLLADPRTDPTLNDNKALFGAIYDCNVEIFTILSSIDAVAKSVNWQDMLGTAEETEDANMIALVKSKCSRARF